MRALTLGTLLLLSSSLLVAEEVSSHTRPGKLSESAISGSAYTVSTDPHELVTRAKAAYVGMNGTVDNATAHDLFLQAAATGDPVALMWVARGYAENRAGFPLDPGQAREIATDVIDDLRALAKRGDIEATFLLACAETQGLGTDQDFESAARHYEEAVKAGNPLAMHNFGLMKLIGKGTPLDPDGGAALIMSAYEKGVTFSMAGLAYCRSIGAGVTVDQEAARNWLEAAGNNGLAQANLVLGSVYLHGEGIPRDLAKAAAYFRAAHENGSVEATYQLALLTGRGEGVTQNLEEGIGLLKQAASNGHPRAQERLTSKGIEWRFGGC